MVLFWFVWSKLQTWLETCSGLDKKLQPPYSIQEPSYNLLSSHISEVKTCVPQKEQKESQHTACIQQTRANIQSASSRREPTYSLHCPATACFLHTLVKLQPAFPRKNKKRANIQPASNRREPTYSLHPPDESQLTACIVQTRANLQPALSRWEPTYSQHPPDESQHTASILQMRANIQPASSRWEPAYSQHPPDESQDTACILQMRASIQPVSFRQSQITACILPTYSLFRLSCNQVMACGLQAET